MLLPQILGQSMTTTLTRSKFDGYDDLVKRSGASGEGFDDAGLSTGEIAR